MPLRRVVRLGAMTSATVFAFSIWSPAAARDDNPLTSGNVSLHLQVGKTTEAEVLEAFGSPNIVTQAGTHRDVWSYQRHASVSRENDGAGFFNILVLGAGGARRATVATQRTMTLIIKFGPDHVVSDFSSRSSEF